MNRERGRLYFQVHRFRSSALEAFSRAGPHGLAYNTRAHVSTISHGSRQRYLVSDRITWTGPSNPDGIRLEDAL